MDKPYLNIVGLKEYIDREILHLKDLMDQHDKMTAIAIEKSEESYNERFAKTNEFRAQQNDIIQTFAKGDETKNSFISMNEKFEQNIRSATDRFEKGNAMLIDKINHVENHLDEKIIASILVQSNRFEATDKQMQTLIDANAEISNRGLTELNKWKENTSGSIRVILAVGGFIVGVVIILLGVWINKLF